MHRKAFTIIELLVVIGIIALLMSILLGEFEMARHRAYIVKCASNLRTIGQAIELYAIDNQGQYPRTRYQPGAPPVAGTAPDAANPFSATGPAENDVTAAVYLLATRNHLPAALLYCPYNDVNVFEPEPALRVGRSNFTDYRKNLGYSFANPYPSAAAEAAGYHLLRSSHLPAGFPLAADLNPGPHAGNSKNHEDDGQNVLYADGHVDWRKNTAAGIGNDDIYHNRAGQVMDSPADGNDAVLLPGQD